MGSDWQEYELAELAADVPNAVVGGPFGSNLGTADYVDAPGVPVIRGGNMGAGRWVGGEFAFVSEQKADELSSNIALPGDLVFTQRGTLGQVALVPEDGFDRYVVSQSQMKITLDRARADGRFLFYLFSSAEQKEYIRQNAIQTGVPHTNLGIMRKTPVVVPPLREQRAIAEVLGSLDDKIELNRRMNGTLESMARALFKSWFVDFDPVHANAAGQPTLPSDLAARFPATFEPSPLGDIPKAWRTGTLGDVLITKKDAVSLNDLNEESAYIGLEHMPRRSISLDRWGTAAELKSNKNGFSRGDILFGKLRPYFHKVGLAPIDGVCSTDILVVTPESPEWSGFSFCHCFSDPLIAHVTALSNGAKMPRTKWKDIKEYEVVLPPAGVAEDFAGRLCPLFERVNSNIHESRTLAALRDTLLPRLLSGELSVTQA